MTTFPQRILVVEDDPAQRALLCAYLAQDGFCVMEACNALEFTTALRCHSVDLILLDLNLPDADGLTLARELRKNSSIPLIMVTSRDKAMDRINGLEIGADDYVTKPYHPRELVLRIRNLLQKITPEKILDGHRYSVGRFTLDIDCCRLDDETGEEIRLTSGEFSLLTALAQSSGRVLNRDQLLEAIPNREELPFDRTADVLISRLRRKIERNSKKPELLETIKGYGYRLKSQRI
ncbi:response regulator [Desulfobacterota bacterium M19]